MIEGPGGGFVVDIVGIHGHLVGGWDVLFGRLNCLNYEVVVTEIARLIELKYYQLIY